MPNRNPFVPRDPITYTLRPLTKGIMVYDHPSEIPKEGLYDIIGYIVKQNGLRRIPGTVYHCASNAVSTNDVPLLDIGAFWDSSNNLQIPCLLTSRWMYSLSSYSAPTVIPWEYTTGTAQCDGSGNVTGTGTDWDATNHCLSQDGTAAGTKSHDGHGDWIAFDSDSYATWYEIKDITSGTDLDLKCSLS